MIWPLKSKKRKVVDQAKMTVKNMEDALWLSLMKGPDLAKDLVLIDAMATSICTYFIGVKFDASYEKYITPVVKSISFETSLKIGRIEGNTISMVDGISMFLNELKETQENYYAALKLWESQQNQGAESFLETFLQRRKLFFRNEKDYEITLNFIDQEISKAKNKLGPLLKSTVR